MKIEFCRKHAGWPGRNRYVFALLDDAGDAVMVNEAMSLDHARRCAIRAAKQLECLAWCADCDWPAWRCQCVEEQDPSDAHRQPEREENTEEFPSYPCPHDPDGAHHIGCGCMHE